ncbi:hypothetical protein BH11PSE13_BH11PSE13_13380 [soil metagenome]
MTTPCKRCEKSGLPILLARPSAVAVDRAFAPPGSAVLVPHQGTVAAFGLPALQKSKYILRLLRREGFVYVYYPEAKPSGMIKPWEVYKVHDQGALLPQGEFVFDESKFACSKKITHPHDVRTICIREPEVVQKVWIGFSMNWWSDKIKGDVIGNLTAAGMVEVNLLAGPPANGFKAGTGLIQQHVADYAIQQMTHAGVDSPTPFWPAGKVAASEAARIMAEVMRKQASGSPDSKGKQMVVALPDPVGLAADLNGIRIARDKAFKDALLASKEAWPTTTNAALTGLASALRSAGMLRAANEAYGSTSQKEWDKLKTQPYFQVGFSWEASKDGSKAADGSANGRIVEPQDVRRGRRVARRGELIGEADARLLEAQVDGPVRKAWQAQRKTALAKEADELYLYESDWLGRTKGPAALRYFRLHFDEDDANRLTAPVSAGAIYARESHLIHFPQPLSTQQCAEDYLALTMDLPITAREAVALRAMFGNQKSAIEQAHAILIGEMDRSGENMRDKTYDFMKGLVTTEAGRKYSWMTDIVAALALGQVTALTAAATSLVTSPANAPQAEPYLRKLPKICLAQQGFEAALEAARTKGQVLDMPVLLELKLNAREAVAILAGKTAAARAVEWVMHTEKGEVKLWALTSIDAIEKLRDPKSTSPGSAPARLPSAGHGGGDLFENLKARAASLDAIHLTPNKVTRVLNYQNERAIGAVREARIDTFESKADMRLAVGSLIVQGLGMYWGIKALGDAYSGEGAEAEKKRREAWLSVGDSASGLATAVFELAHAGQSIRLVGQGGTMLAKASTLLPMLEMGAALAGVGGGIINMWISWDKAKEASGKGNTEAAQAYTIASIAFAGTAGTSFVLVVQAGAEAALKRFIGQRVVMIIAGAITEAGIGGVAVGVVASKAGWVLLGAGIVATVVAMNEPTPIEKWANRSYFGKGGRGFKFKDVDEEQFELGMALNPTGRLPIYDTRPMEPNEGATA